MINYIILASYQVEELKKLLTHLKINNIDFKDIIIIVDTDNTNQDVLDIIEDNQLTYFSHPLNKDFGEHRNFAKQQCWHPYLFYIDSDEIPSAILLQKLPFILNDNPDIDIFAVPRINYYINDTDMTEIPLWINNLPADEYGRINWPDFQLRIMKNISNIYWVGKVHETVTGGKTACMPAIEEFALTHIKTISGQIKRVQLYNEISHRTLPDRTV
jgi:hypothetical protein